MLSRSSAMAIVFMAAASASTLGLLALQELPPGQGRDVTQGRCAAECHGIDKVMAGNVIGRLVIFCESVRMKVSVGAGLAAEPFDGGDRVGNGVVLVAVAEVGPRQDVLARGLHRVVTAVTSADASATAVRVCRIRT